MIPFLLRQRIEKDIWQDLYEPILLETNVNPDEILLHQLFNEKTGINLLSQSSFISTSQKLSHQLVRFRFYTIQENEPVSVENYKWVSKTELRQLPFPKTIQEIISSQLLAI